MYEMKRSLSSLVGTLCLAMLGAACSSGDGGGNESSPTTTSVASGATSTQLRAVHASADTGAVDVRVNGANTLQGIAFREAPSAVGLAAGNVRVQVNPAGSSTSAIDVSVPLAPNRDYYVIAAGNSSAGTRADQALGALLIEDEGNSPQAGNVKVRVVHGAPGIPAVNIFVTAPQAALPPTPTISALTYRQAAPASGQRALEIAGGNYQVRAVVAGQTAIAFDSGAITLPTGADLLLIAVPSKDSASPIALLAVPKGASAFEVVDQRAQVRVGHFSPNTPTVDVYLRAPGAPLNAGNLVAPDVVFGMSSNFQSVIAGSYRASVALDTQSTEAIGLDASLSTRQNVSVFAVGLLGGAGNQALRLQAYADDLSPPPAGRAKLRVMHLSPDAPVVDVVVLDGAGAVTLRPVTGLAFPNATGYLDLAPGTYRVAVVPAGASTPLLPAAANPGAPAGVSLTLAPGDVTTALAVGCLNAAAGPCAGGNHFQIIALEGN
ncbi:MAG: DUF4397 domain-containing protein [Burkholderiales bacterium]